MANKSVLELAVGTGQWDAGLKKAKDALNNFTQAQGGLQSALKSDSDKMQQFVQMMGKMDSSAKTAKGQLNDYKGTIEQLTMQYNRMTDAQKQTIGQDYLQAIDQLKQKYQSVNKEIEEMNRQLKASPEITPSVSGGGGLFSGDKFSGMLQVFGGNLMTKAAGFGVDFVSKMGDMVKQGVELAKASEGVRLAFERLNQPGILDNLREATHGTVTDLELMKAAVKFNDFKLPLEELGTMLAFAQQKAKDTGQSVDYMVDSIVTGLGRKSLMILDNLGLSAAEIKDKMKETGDMTKAVGEIIREQMQQAGDYVETASDRATQANVKLQNKMEELGRKFGPLQEASTNFWTSMKIGILDVIGGPLTTLLNYLTQAQKTAEELVTGSMNQVGSNVDDKGNYIKRPAQKGAAGFDWDKGTWKPGYYGAIYNSATGQTEFPDINVNGTRREKTTPTTPKVNTFDLSKIAFDENKAMLSGVKAVDTMPSVWSMLGDQGMRDMLGIGKKQTFDLGKDISTKWKVDKNGQLVDKTGKDEKQERTAEEQLQGTQTMISSLQSIVTGIDQLGIQLPKELTNIFGVLQTITGIVGAIQTMQTVGTFLGIFHNGGIVPHAASGTVAGSHFSGDVTPIMANAGEVVLNKAQTNHLANELTTRDNGSGGNGRPYVDGETIYLGLSAYLKSTGRGEIMTSRFK